jgi:DNA polymerase III delta prime subunit
MRTSLCQSSADRFSHRAVSLQEWQDIQQKLSTQSYPPTYIEHKHDAEEYIELGDYRRALVDLATACELFLRTVVLRSLPDGLGPNLREAIEQDNISQYFNRFFPKTISEAARQQYKKKQYGKNNMPKELGSLFKRRNDLLHSGNASSVNREVCERFLKMTKDLLALE